MTWRATLLLCSVLTLRAASAGGAELAISLPGNAYAVPGILALPAAPAPVPGVVLLHGTASQKNEVGDLYRHLAERLAAAGIASLRIDFAGSGGSPVSHRSYNLDTATRDAQRALDYLARHEAVDGNALAVLGFSQGGLIAQRVALAYPGIRALVTWSTVATDGMGSFAPFFAQHYATAQAAGYADVSFPWLAAPLAFDLRWFDDVKTHTTLSDMRAFGAPILAIAGLEDDTVPYAQSIDLVSQSPNPRSRAVLLAGANHIFNGLDAGVHDGPAAGLLEATVAYLVSSLARD